MTADLSRRLEAYSSSVVTFIDDDGYPSSFRCVPVIGVEGKLSLAKPRMLRVKPGPAGLLCHFHDEGLWNQRSFVAKGELRVSDEEIIFTPTSLVEGLAKGRRMIALLSTGRRRARQYLQRRGLPRPEIPWGELRAIKTTVFPLRPQPVLYLSAAYLVVAASGTWLATASDLPAQALGLRSGLSVLTDFFVGFGTALSAPFALLVVLVALNVALWAGRRVATAITLLGTAFTAGMLAEPIFWEFLSPTTTGPIRAVIAANIVIPLSLARAAWSLRSIPSVGGKAPGELSRLGDSYPG